MTSLIIFLKKVKNTFLTPRWNTIYSSFDKIFSKNKKNKLLFWFLDKFWFFPYDLQAHYWHNADYDSRHYFTHYKSLDYGAKQLIKNIKTVIGTSVGAVFAIIFVLNIPIFEIELFWKTFLNEKNKQLFFLFFHY